MAAKKQKKGAQPSAKGAAPQLTQKRHKGRRPESMARARNLQASAEVKAEAYNRVAPTAASLPPYTEYTAALGQVLADMVVDGAMLDNIATLPNTPPLRDMLRWIRDTNHPFCKIYYEAKDAQVALYEERALHAALVPERQMVITRRQVLDKDGNIVNVVEERVIDNVARSELKFKAYGWSLGYLRPKKHGKTPDGSGEDANPQLKSLFDSLNEGPV